MKKRLRIWGKQKVGRKSEEEEERKKREAEGQAKKRLREKQAMERNGRNKECTKKYTKAKGRKATKKA